jgi:hypothetical protein
MKTPDLTASTSDWQLWADENYPFDGKPPGRRTGFDLIRSVSDTQLRGEMAWAVARGMGPDVSPPEGFRKKADPEPDRRLPPEYDPDASGIEEL